MKKLLKCCVAFLSLLFVISESRAEAIIKGHIKNASKGVVQIQYKEPVLDYNNYFKTTIVGDSFELRIKLTNPTQISIWVDQTGIAVFALPDDNVTVDFDNTNPQQSLVTKSSHNDDNLFLNELKKIQAAQQSEMINLGNGNEKDIQKQVNKQFDKYKRLRESLYYNASRRYKFSAAFNSYIFDGQKYSYAADALQLYMAHAMDSMKGAVILQGGQPMATKQVVDSLLKLVPVENAALLTSQNYTGFLHNYTMYKGQEMDRLMNPEELRNRTNDVWMKTKFTFYEQHFTDPAVRYAVLVHDIGSLAATLPSDVVTKWGTYIVDHYPDGRYNAALRKIIAGKRKLTPGNLAPDFELEDIKGKKVSLASLKGKVLYIDFWASWCFPCMHENKLVRDMKPDWKGKDLLFVYITRDEDKQKWKEAVSQQTLEGLHLFAGNSTVFSDYQSESVPHYYLLDKEGKIISSSAPRPSEKDQLIPMLDKALR